VFDINDARYNHDDEVGVVLCSLLRGGTVVDLISGLCIVNEGPCYS